MLPVNEPLFKGKAFLILSLRRFISKTLLCVMRSPIPLAILCSSKLPFLISKEFLVSRVQLVEIRQIGSPSLELEVNLISTVIDAQALMVQLMTIAVGIGLVRRWYLTEFGFGDPAGEK